MDESKKAKFFCEGCGAEVPSNAKFCKKCGRFFAAVRCPNCGHIGTAKAFAEGCPACHYAFPQNGQQEKNGESKTLDGMKHKLSRKSHNSIKKAFRGKTNGKNTGDDVPTWLFLPCIIVLVVIFAFIIVRCRN